MSALPCTPEQRREDQRICNRWANQDFKLDPQEFQAHLESRYELDQEEVYRYLGSFTRKQFLIAYGVDQNLHRRIYTDTQAFKTLRSFLAAAPNSYQAYCEARQKQPDLEELRATLQRSTDTPARLLSLPRPTNLEGEYFLGLNGGAIPLTSEALVFEDTWDGPYYLVNDTDFDALIDEPEYRDGMAPHWQRCPARRLVLTQILPAMIDLAVDTPFVYPQHLGLTPVQYEHGPAITDYSHSRTSQCRQVQPV